MQRFCRPRSAAIALPPRPPRRTVATRATVRLGRYNKEDPNAGHPSADDPYDVRRFTALNAAGYAAALAFLFPSGDTAEPALQAVASSPPAADTAASTVAARLAGTAVASSSQNSRDTNLITSFVFPTPPRSFVGKSIRRERRLLLCGLPGDDLNYLPAFRAYLRFPPVPDDSVTPGGSLYLRQVQLDLWGRVAARCQDIATRDGGSSLAVCPGGTATAQKLLASASAFRSAAAGGFDDEALAVAERALDLACSLDRVSPRHFVGRDRGLPVGLGPRG